MFSSKNTRMRCDRRVTLWRRVGDGAFQRLAGLHESRAEIVPVKRRKILDNLIYRVSLGEILEEDLDLDAGAAEDRASTEDSLVPNDHRVGVLSHTDTVKSKVQGTYNSAAPAAQA